MTSPIGHQSRSWNLGNRLSATFGMSITNLPPGFSVRATAVRNALFSSSSKKPKLPQKQKAPSKASCQGS